MKFYFPDINVWVAMACRGYQRHAGMREFYSQIARCPLFSPSVIAITVLSRIAN